MGVANDRSIAWGIAKCLANNGASIALTYQGEALKKRVEPLAQSINSDILKDIFKGQILPKFSQNFKREIFIETQKDSYALISSKLNKKYYKIM